MKSRIRWLALAVVALLAAGGYVVLLQVVPPAAAAALLYPLRFHVAAPPPPGCVEAMVTGAGGVALSGWRCEAVPPRRGTLVFIHGVANNRLGLGGALERFRARGFDVAAFDCRAHGNSGGDVCTYGYYEKRDLAKIVETVGPGPVILFGASLGAAIALQEAPDDPRITGVVSIETFSDLRTVARERAPKLLTEAMIRRAFAVAEERGQFQVDAVSPVAAAARIHIPVLVVHGDADTETPTDHSRRVMAALAGPKELILVPGAHHNESLQSEETWKRIEAWVDRVVGSGRSQESGVGSR